MSGKIINIYILTIKLIFEELSDSSPKSNYLNGYTGISRSYKINRSH